MELLHKSGEIIAQRYCIVDTLGQGGSGTTYLAQDLQNSQPVALKALSLSHLTDWKMMELFEREASVLAQLNHPGIPRYLDYFHVDTPSDRSFYIVQQLAEGKSLAALVEEGWHASEEQVRGIASQVLEILVYLHSLKPPVIHRDIKPQNIIRREDGQVFLVDFGAVQNTYHTTFARGSTMVGTFGYMAPEQFIGQAVPATDLYSLGATLLFLLTHRSPADLPTDNLKIDFRSSVQIAQEFAELLEKMLQPDVADRFPSAKEALLVLHGKRKIRAKSRFPIAWQALIGVGIVTIVAINLVNSHKYMVLRILGIKLTDTTMYQATTMLYQAAARGDVDAVKYYLKQGVDSNGLGMRDNSLYLRRSFSSGDNLSNDVKVDTPLHRAVYENRKEVVQLLINHGADINIRDINGATPLFRARTKEMAQLLIANGVDINVKDYGRGTPLYGIRSKEVAQLLIDKGLDVNAKARDRLTPLHLAESKEVAQLLIDKGADINAKDKHGKTPLNWARSKEIAQLLIDKGADPNVKDKDGKTPLHRAESKEIAQLLIDKGADPNVRDKDGKTPLHTVQYGKNNLVVLLLAKGADVNAKDKLGQTPLHFVAEHYGNNELVELLLTKGADVNAKDNQGTTPLHATTALYAATALEAQHNKSKLKLLLAKGADVNAKDNEGQTPLHFATLGYNNKEMVELLLAKGADVKAKDNQGQTPLHFLAAEYGKNDLVVLLLAKGADVKAKDNQGQTPLHIATAPEAKPSENKSKLKLLLAKGADINAKDNQGITPLHLATQGDNNKEVIELLLAKGADINAKDNQGRTPLSWAKLHHNPEVAELLKKHGGKE